MAVFDSAASSSLLIELPDGFGSIEASTESDSPAASAEWNSIAASEAV